MEKRATCPVQRNRLPSYTDSILAAFDAVKEDDYGFVLDAYGRSINGEACEHCEALHLEYEGALDENAWSGFARIEAAGGAR